MLNYPFCISPSYPMCRLLFIKEVVSLIYLVSVYDPFFDTHLKQCEYWYVFVLNRLSFLFSTAKGEAVDEGTCTWIITFCVCEAKYYTKTGVH